MDWSVIFTVHFWLTRGTISSENQRSRREYIATALYFNWFKHKSSSGWTPENKVYLVEERIEASTSELQVWQTIYIGLVYSAQCTFTSHSPPSPSLLRDWFGGHIWAGQMLEVDWKTRRKGSWRLASSAAATTGVHITRTHSRAARWPGDTTGCLCVILLSPSPHPIHILCTTGHVPRRH